MRHLKFRVLVLLLMVGFLFFAGAARSGAVMGAPSCAQACYNLYSECLGGGQGDFFWCCAAYNECLQENCASGPKCHLPEPWPPE